MHREDSGEILSARRLTTSFDLVHLLTPLPHSSLNVGLAHATHFGNTALFAAFEGYVFVAALLLDRGANVKASNKDPNCPLFLTTSAGCLEMAEILLNRGGLPDVSRFYGWRALNSRGYRVPRTGANTASTRSRDLHGLPWRCYHHT